MNEELFNKEKKILRLRIIYWAIIFGILAVFLLCIAPGRVDERAFENFSFASIIVSIVLAVVSIVYSFRTKSVTSDNIAGIREIEDNIDHKLNKFDSLEKNISDEIHASIVEGVGRAITDLREDFGILRDDQADIKQNISRIVSDQKKFFEISVQTASHKQGGNNKIFKSGVSYIGGLAMYIACLCHKTKKPIDFSSFGDTIQKDLDYFWGYYSALSSCFPDDFEYQSPAIETFDITKYNTEQLGDEKHWEKVVLSFGYDEQTKQSFEIIKAYFGIDKGNVEV